MKPYLSREISLRAIKKMAKFENMMSGFYERFDLDFRSNLGRRNIIVSQAQEEFFARELQKEGHDITVSGRTGEPDIMINDINKELECKLTSGSSRGTWALQTDYTTLSKKGTLDYLYVLADYEFKRFSVLFFDGLTKDDFHKPGPGARDKGRMNKIHAMDKCSVLLGEVRCRNDAMIEKYAIRFRDVLAEFSEVLSFQNQRLQNVSERAAKRRKNLEGIRDRIIERYIVKLRRLEGKSSKWMSAPLQFSIDLEEIDFD